MNPIHKEKLILRNLKELNVSWIVNPTPGKYVENNLWAIIGCTSNQARELFKSKGLKFIDLAPWCFSVWSSQKDDYIKLWFLDDLMPSMSHLETKVRYAETVACYLPKWFFRSGHFIHGNEDVVNLGWYVTDTLGENYTTSIIPVGYSKHSWLTENCPWIVSVHILAAMNNITDLGVTELTYWAEDVDVLHPHIFREELVKALNDPKPSIYFRQLNQAKMLKKLMPELHANIKCMQDARWHKEDVFDHLMRCVDKAHKYVPKDANVALFKLAVLLHDVGKAPTRKDVS